MYTILVYLVGPHLGGGMAISHTYLTQNIHTSLLSLSLSLSLFLSCLIPIYSLRESWVFWERSPLPTHRNKPSSLFYMHCNIQCYYSHNNYDYHLFLVHVQKAEKQGEAVSGFMDLDNKQQGLYSYHCFSTLCYHVNNYYTIMLAHLDQLTRFCLPCLL